ncbi:MAG: hypothetical protein JWO05_411 [Gemmatimonadetes bacterium]|nr:hypothetical protein [Gemmatimonadota bacterium]
MRVKHRLLATVALAATAIACGQIADPAGGILSVSSLIPAWPSVVIGDVLRDSVGQPAPLSIVAYDVQGNAVTTVTATFVTPDTGIRLDGNLLYGVKLRTGAARVYAQVGALQTAAASVDVVESPDSLARGAVRTAAISPSLLDSASASSFSEAILATVLHKGATVAGVKSWVVKYTIVRQPAGESASLPSATIVDEAGHASPIDSTTTAGVASRRVQVKAIRLLDPRVADSVIVRVTAQYKGVALPGSPYDVVIPFTPKAAARIP